MQKRKSIAKSLAVETAKSFPREIAEQVFSAYQTEVKVAEDRQKKRAIAVNLKTGSASSRKSRNAFLNLRSLIQKLATIIQSGFTAYSVPLLFIPASLKMLCDARELVSVDLNQAHACVLLAINELAKPKGGAVADSDVLRRAMMIAQNAPLHPSDETILSKAVIDLVGLRCLERPTDGYVQIAEKVRIVGW